MNDSPKIPNPAAGFHKQINQHGYAFQYNLLERAGKLYNDRVSRWAFEAAEFPVEVQGFGTRIDFILKHRDRSAYLLAECKRANPALSNWCFAKAPFVRRNRTSERIFAERFERISPEPTYRSAAVPISYTSEAYHVALEVRSGQTGDSSGQGRGAIEEAVTQVCRGLNGFVEFLSAYASVLNNEIATTLLPVVITTANLWTSDANLAASHPDTGELESSPSGLNPKLWVAYQYHQSPGLKHTTSNQNPPRELGEFLDQEFIRTVHIVNTRGLEPFLRFWSDQFD